MLFAGLCALVGFLTVMLIVQRAELHMRIAFTVLAGVMVPTILTFVLASSGIFSPQSLTILLGLVAAALAIAFFAKRSRTARITILSWRTTIFITVIAATGTAWRWLFKARANEWGDGLTSHVGTLLADPMIESGGAIPAVPDLNFYTGLLADYATYVTPKLLDSVLVIQPYLETFLNVFVTSALAYALIRAYNPDNRIALLGAAIMAIGPVEIWQNTFHLIGGDLSYAGLMLLTLAMRREDSQHLAMTLLVGIGLIVTYYTASVVLTIAAIGFLVTIISIHVLSRGRLELQTIRNDKRILVSFLIIIATITFLSVIAPNTTGSHLTTHSTATIRSVADTPMDVPDLPEISTPRPTHPYTGDTTALGYSMILWQDLALLILASTFIMHLIRKRVDDDDRAVLRAIPSLVLVGVAFLVVNMEQRSFSYLAPFAFAALRLYRKAIVIIAIIALFFVSTTYVVASDRIVFFDNSLGEIEAAAWISENVNGTVLSDARFTSLLAQYRYFDVDGFGDASYLMDEVFYTKDADRIRSAMCRLNVSYFATSERMRTDYVLMANFPSEPSNNSDVYIERFPSIYDNGDVIVFDVSLRGCER